MLSLVVISYYYFRLPTFIELIEPGNGRSIVFLDKNQKKFSWRGKILDNSLRAENVNQNLLKAIIATEDKHYFSHFGLSLRGILGAIKINISEGRGPLTGHGGSTITQQVAKLLCFLNEEKKTEAECRRQTLGRKFLEALFSVALEMKFSKEEILSIYLNKVYLGAGTTGFEAASNRYFDKSVTDLNIAEAAMLAGLLTAPSRYSPTNDLLRSQARAKTVIKLMRDQDVISEMQAEQALKSPAQLFTDESKASGEYLSEWILKAAENELKNYAFDDLEFQTSFDPDIQYIVEKSVFKIFEKFVMPNSKAEVAIVVLSSTGDVVAMLGGRDTVNSGRKFNRAVQALRQPGSAYKPFVYAAALESGYSPNFKINDRLKTFTESDGKQYRPKNYNKVYLGSMSLTSALANSVNTVTVELANRVGIENVLRLSKSFGVKQSNARGLANALGTNEVTLLEMTSAYAGFLNLGVKVTARGWSKMKNKSDGAIVQNLFPSKENVISEQTSRYLLYMLRESVKNGTGRAAQINNWDVGGKTGTTQSARDAWFIGFTSDYVAGVWIGNDNNKSLKGVSGSTLPARIWKEIMKNIHEEPPEPLPVKFPPMDDYVLSDPSTEVDQGKNTFRSQSLIKKFINLFGF